MYNSCVIFCFSEILLYICGIIAKYAVIIDGI